MTQYFQFVKVYTPFGTGVRLLPAAASVGLSSLLGTRLAVSIGNKIVVGTGLVFFGAALLWVSTGSGQTSYWVIVLQMVDDVASTPA